MIRKVCPCSLISHLNCRELFVAKKEAGKGRFGGERTSCRALSFKAIVFLTKQKCKKANGRKKRAVSERHQRVDAIVMVGERQTFAKLARETRSRSNALIIQPESLWLASSTPGSTKAPLLFLISILIPRPRRRRNAGKSHKPTFISI